MENENLKQEKVMSGLESLEVITSMIQKTKEASGVHSGDGFIVWGWTTVAIAIATSVACFVTRDAHWNLLWWLVPVIGFPLSYWVSRRHKPTITTYTGNTVNKLWCVTGIALGLLGILFWLLKMPAIYIMPLVLILTSIGTSTTGLIIREPLVTWLPLVGFCIAIWMLSLFFAGNYSFWSLAGMGVAMLVMMVIPGHYLNHKYNVKK